MRPIHHLSHSLLFSMALLGMASGAAATPIIGGYALTYADSDPHDATPGEFHRNYVFDNSVQSATSSSGTPANSVSTQSQSDAWLTRLAVQSNLQQGLMVGGGISMFAINQRVTGDPGNATVSYTFHIDGSFAPGPAANYPSAAGTQGMNFYLLAYHGQALGLSVAHDSYGEYLRLDTTGGYYTVSRDPSAPGYVSGGNWFAAAGLCSNVDTRCQQGASFNDTRTLTFSMPTNEDYYILGFLFGQTNGQLDFFHTAKLQQIDLAPQYGLTSDDGGALVRGANGTFTLAAGVPEPATWAMLILGFGVVGGAMRSRRRALRPA